MERFEKNPDFLQDLFVEETWKNIERLDNFIESKSGTEQVEITERDGLYHPFWWRIRKKKIAM